MIDLASTFEMLCKTESDINEHLPTLYDYGRRVDHITEFGVRNGRSTVAWQYANPKTLISYDIDYCDINERLFEMSEEAMESLVDEYIPQDMPRLTLQERSKEIQVRQEHVQRRYRVF
jgi:hypothetical protein